jgi:pyridinium-3,5-bisthiocarboxylic acid mononucleotide nickel chelatase
VSLSRVLYFDCASGASGDMLLGAVVDLGLSLDDLRSELAGLALEGYRLESRKVHRAGLHATKVDVVTSTAHHCDEGGHHAHEGEAGHHPHEHQGAHGHRGLAQILELIDGSRLSDRVKRRSSALFRRLADAEAAVHGTTPESVHFHEVGAIDSIVDIVGGVFALDWLRVDRFVSSPLNLGAGTVTMSHGTFSVPPPATAHLVQGVPVYGAGDGELLTPTGALLVTAHSGSYGPLPPLRLEAVGHGAGTRDTAGRPNVLRLILGEEDAAVAGDRVLVLEAEMDDMSPQLCGPLLDRLLATGALDGYYTPVQMKKGRPGILVTVLCEPGLRERLEETLFAESTTIGVRRQECDRTVLARDVVPVETPYGTIGVKVASRGGRRYNVQPEFEDCQRAAIAHGVPVKEVWAAALVTYRNNEGASRP